MTLRTTFTAMLYAATALVANPTLAADISAADRAAILEMRSDTLRRLVVHDQAIEARSQGFQAADGTPMSIPADGTLRVVNFWATWCAPCREEMPSLASLRSAAAGQLDVLTIATGRNRIQDIERFNAEMGITNLPIYLDPRGEMASAYGVMGLPATIILDGQGREIARMMGAADWASEPARAVLLALAAATAD